MDKSVIEMVLDSDWTDLKDYVEHNAALKIKERIDRKKQDIIDNINNGNISNISDMY